MISNTCNLTSLCTLVVGTEAGMCLSVAHLQTEVQRALSLSLSLDPLPGNVIHSKLPPH